jgi:hypothetical protein
MILTLVRWEARALFRRQVVLAHGGRRGARTAGTIVMAGVAILLTAFANADNDVRDHEIDA